MSNILTDLAVALGKFAEAEHWYNRRRSAEECEVIRRNKQRKILNQISKMALDEIATMNACDARWSENIGQGITSGEFETIEKEEQA